MTSDCCLMPVQREPITRRRSAHLPQTRAVPMTANENECVEDQTDFARRRELRSFLMQCRTRLAPVDLGLPRTATRSRVTGLRRGEVAELIGVTDYWYRAFESGRPVRVSPKFVARLAATLRLSPAQQLTLFHLSFPETYQLLRGPHR